MSIRKTPQSVMAAVWLALAIGLAMPGTVTLSGELTGKRLSLLHELLPRARTVAYLRNPLAVLESPQNVMIAAGSLGLVIRVVDARSETDFDAAFATIRELRADALSQPAGSVSTTCSPASACASTRRSVAVPWYASKIIRPFLFMERAPGMPPPPQSVAVSELQTRSISDFHGDQEAYAAAMARDTLVGYEDFLAAYPDSPLAPRVRALIAVRREAITWRRTLNRNMRDAYWSYLRRYPQGAHVADAQRRPRQARRRLRSAAGLRAARL